MVEAKAILEQLDLKNIPNAHISKYANLAVRSASPDLAIRFLWDTIFNRSPSVDELFEYASALRKLGLVNQSLKLAERFPQHPKYLLHKAFCFIARWDYKAARVHLEEFIKLTPPDSRDHRIASVNLASAMIFLSDFNAAEKLIKATLESSRKMYPQLYLNQLELLGQIGIHTENLSDAEKHLSEAHILAGTEVSTTKLFIQKWKLLLSVKQERIDLSHNEVLDFLSAVRKFGHWETLRDWDFQSSLMTRNSPKFLHCYFGTPHSGFRDRKPISESKFTLPSEYFWVDPRTKNEVPQIIDLHSLELEDLAPGKTTHRLILALSSDFYRPWSVERIFDVFFENEIFNPFTSRKRIYKHLGEVKSVLAGAPIEFKATASGYRLRPVGNGCLTIKPEMIFPSPEEFVRFQIETHFGTSSFSKDHLSNLLSLNSNQTQRHLKALADSGSIQRVGLGRGARYKLKAA